MLKAIAEGCESSPKVPTSSFTCESFYERAPRKMRHTQLCSDNNNTPACCNAKF